MNEKLSKEFSEVLNVKGLNDRLTPEELDAWRDSRAAWWTKAVYGDGARPSPVPADPFLSGLVEVPPPPLDRGPLSPEEWKKKKREASRTVAGAESFASVGAVLTAVKKLERAISDAESESERLDGRIRALTRTVRAAEQVRPPEDFLPEF